MASRRMGKEPASSSGGPPSKRQHRQGITAYNSEITSKGIGIKLLSLNIYILVGILILIL